MEKWNSSYYVSLAIEEPGVLKVLGFARTRRAAELKFKRSLIGPREIFDVLSNDFANGLYRWIVSNGFAEDVAEKAVREFGKLLLAKLNYKEVGDGR